MPLTDFQFSPVETDRLLIRSVAEKPFDLDDEPQMIDAFFNSIPDDKAKEAVADKEAVFELLRNLKSFQQADKHHYLATLNSGEPVLHISISLVPDSYPGISISVLQPYRHKGFGKEALAAVLNQYFDAGVEGFIYSIRPDNTASEKLVLALGGEEREPKSAIASLLQKEYVIRRQNWKGAL